MLKDQVKKYIDLENEYGDQKNLYHYNCAEVILNACNDYYNLNLDKRALKMIAPFGGGMASEKTCGILTGGVAAIGVMFTEDKPSENLKLKEVTKRWVNEFENEFGDTNCNILKETKRDEIDGCKPLMIKGSEILEDIINKYR